MIEWMIEWMNDWMNDWLNDWMNKWMNKRKLNERIIVQLTEASLSDPCMLTNPKELSKKEVGEIYERILII